MIIDAKNKIVGRIATVAAKSAILGEKVDIVNCEQAIITGKKDYLHIEAKRKRDMGTFKGPFYSRMPDRFLRRMIRGMLPYKQDKGKNAYKKIMCYVGLPKEFEGKDLTNIKEADMSKLSNKNYVSIKDVCKKLGGKWVK